jgi:transposase-like protein
VYKSYRSIKRQLHHQEVATPPYCPKPGCDFHTKQGGDFRRHGLTSTKRFPYSALRFRCRSCKRTFTGSFFTLEYRQKIWGQNKEIFTLNRMGVSKREIARELKHSEHFVRSRLIKMARWAILKHAKLSGEIIIKEPIVYDGLENFSFSQYDPNNLNHAVGKKSLFTYDFNLCPINRKGRMSPFQQGKKLRLEKTFGSYPKNAIRTSSTKIFTRLHQRAELPFVLYSDKHFQYKRSLALDLAKLEVTHITVSSKVCRNFHNPLFAVNNIDMQARHNLAAFKRETIAFAKNPIAMLESFVLYMAHRNYMRPKFWGTHRSDPLCSKRSPAMELGITEKILNFNEFFKERICITQVKLHQDWQNLYNRADPLSRQTITNVATI